MKTAAIFLIAFLITVVATICWLALTNSLPQNHRETALHAVESLEVAVTTGHRSSTYYQWTPPEHPNVTCWSSVNRGETPFCLATTP